MNVIQFKRSRVVKATLLGLAGLAALILVVRSSGSGSGNGADFRRLPLNPRNRDYDAVSAVKGPLVSHPGVKPVYKGQGKAGNFEPPQDLKVSTQ